MSTSEGGDVLCLDGDDNVSKYQRLLAKCEEGSRRVVSNALEWYQSDDGRFFATKPVNKAINSNLPKR